MRQNKKNDKSLILLSSNKGKSSEKGQKCICRLFELKQSLYCECMLATLLQNRAQYLSMFVIGKLLNFVLFVRPVVCMDLQCGYLENRNHARVSEQFSQRAIFLGQFLWKESCIRQFLLGRVGNDTRGNCPTTKKFNQNLLTYFCKWKLDSC